MLASIPSDSSPNRPFTGIFGLPEWPATQQNSYPHPLTTQPVEVVVTGSGRPLTQPRRSGLLGVDHVPTPALAHAPRCQHVRDCLNRLTVDLPRGRREFVAEVDAKMSNRDLFMAIDEFDGPAKRWSSMNSS